jgi:hypothetical protein
MPQDLPAEAGETQSLNVVGDFGKHIERARMARSNSLEEPTSTFPKKRLTAGGWPSRAGKALARFLDFLPVSFVSAEL